MAEKKQTATFEGIMGDLRAAKFAPAYILMGDEAYFIDQITDYIAQHALAEGERDFNQTVCFGSDVTSGQVADMARRFPMMAERQVVIVKEAQNIKNWDRWSSISRSRNLRPCWCWPIRTVRLTGARRFCRRC